MGSRGKSATRSWLLGGCVAALAVLVAVGIVLNAGHGENDDETGCGTSGSADAGKESALVDIRGPDIALVGRQGRTDELRSVLDRCGLVERYWTGGFDDSAERKSAVVFVDLDWSQREDVADVVEGLMVAVDELATLSSLGPPREHIAPSPWREWDVEVLLRPALGDAAAETLRRKVDEDARVNAMEMLSPEQSYARASELGIEGITQDQVGASIFLSVADAAQVSALKSDLERMEGVDGVLVAPRYGLP